MVKMRLLDSLLGLVLFLCMAHPCFSASGREMVVVFKGGRTEVPYEENSGRITKRRPLAFRLPAFVGGVFNNKEFFMLFCDARYNGYSNWSFIEPAVRTSYGDYTTWSAAEILVKNSRKSFKKSVAGRITAVLKGDKIYVLAQNWDELHIVWFNPRDNTGWDPLMIVGTVTHRTESNGTAGVYVKWDKGTSLKSILPNTVLGATGLRFVGGLGNGIVTKNGTIIFPIQIANYEWQYTASIMYSTDDGSSWHIGGTIEEGTSECSVTEWGNGKLLLSTRYDGGYRKVYESNDMGTTWKESTMFSGVWGNDPNRMGIGSQGSLITVPVDGNDVLLFSHPLNKKEGYKSDTLQLWMSYGQRILRVGTISENGKGENSGYSILAHVGNHLFVVHEIDPYGERGKYNDPLKEWNRVIALSSIPDLFDSVKSTVRAWRQLDAELKTKGVPTNGLVGFLAGSKNNTVWEDKYNCVHATVNGATRVEGGFRFDGTQGSGAQWPVQGQGQNQFYIFTEKQFTIAATVKIHSTAETGDHLLLGASVDEAGTKLFIGLGYTQDNRWSFVDDSGKIMTTGVLFELEKEYHVAITYSNGKVSVYVDGEAIIKGHDVEFSYNYFNHFFMGGNGKTSQTKSCVCTVKDVMLFNRDIIQPKETEIQKVEKDSEQKDSKSSTKPQETSDASRHGIPNDDGNDKTDKRGSPASTNSTENPTSDNRSRDEYSKKEKKRNDGAVGAISFTARMCFVCSAIVLAWL